MSMLQHAAGAARQVPDALRALVLDDEDFDCRRVRRIGVESGLNVDFVAVGTIAEMCSVLPKHTFDLIFLDYRLGHETGLDALGHIRGDHRNANAAIIMLTGEEKVDVAVSAFRSGCKDFLAKDQLTPEVFRQTVEALLFATSDVSPILKSSDLALDRAIARFVKEKIPRALAEIVSEPTVGAALAEAIRPVISQEISDHMSKYDLPENPLYSEDYQALLAGFSLDES